MDSALSIASLKLQRRLSALEKCRSILEREKIDVPGIVVVGSQSAGKSSVLESISGIAFPRSENLCTICPCVVSLEVDPNISESCQVTVSSDANYEQNRRDCGLEAAGSMIAELSGILSPEKHIKDNCVIYLRVIQKSGPILTLTDLPVSFQTTTCIFLIFQITLS